MATPPVAFRAPDDVKRIIDNGKQMMGMNQTEFLIWALTGPTREALLWRWRQGNAKPSPVENSSEPPAALGSD